MVHGEGYFYVDVLCGAGLRVLTCAVPANNAPLYMSPN